MKEFKWELDPAIVEEAFGNKDRVLEKMLNLTIQYPLIADKLWDDLDFIEQASSIYKTYHENQTFIRFLGENHPDILEKEVFFNLAKNSVTVFRDMWLCLYKDKAQTDPAFKQRLQTEILNHAGFVEKINIGGGYYELYHMLPRAIQLDRAVVKSFCHHHDNSNQLSATLMQSIPDEFFKNADNLKFFLKECTHYVKNLKSQKCLWESWIKEKDTVEEYLPYLTQDMSFVYKKLPEKLRQDKELCKKFLTLAPDLYADLPAEMQNDWDMIMHHMSLPSLGNQSMLSIYEKRLCQPQSEKEALFIAEKMPDFIELMMGKMASNLHDNQFFSEFWKSPNVLKKLGVFSVYLLPREEYHELYEDHEFCLKVLQQNMNNYTRFPAHRKTPEYSLRYLASIKNQTYNPEQNDRALEPIPDTLWQNQDFCLNALVSGKSIMKHVINKIPPQFWYDTDFMLPVCEKLDTGSIEQSMFQFAPLQINQFFVAQGIKAGAYTATLKTYILKESLEKNLQEKETHKTNKVKI